MNAHDRAEGKKPMTNPYTATAYGDAWDQGYSYGYYYPNDTNPSPPTPFVDDQATAYLEGAAAGRDAIVAATGSGDGGMSGNAGGSGYSAVGTEPSSSEQGTTHTIAEVTIEGDPNAAADPNSADDAYAVGYDAGYHGRLEDPSGFAPAVQDSYKRGYNEGGGLHRTEGHEHSDAEEVLHGTAEVGGPAAFDHFVVHGLLHKMMPPVLDLLVMATSPGGDTMLHPPDAYMPVCHSDGHGLSGDAVFDGGAWHGTVTLELNDAQSEGSAHASQWGHPDMVHMWVYDKDNEWNMDITLDPG
jgi:hypothetical protein